MSTSSLLDLWHHAMTVVATCAAPFLLSCLAVGLCVAIIQTATQLQESVLTFVPKLVTTLVVIALSGHWMLDKLGGYMAQAIGSSAQGATAGSVELDGTEPAP
jgi:flagellar biosynthetic protein FliQ